MSISESLGENIVLQMARGKEYACSLYDLAINKSFEQLSQEEKKRCSDVNQILGTERW